MPVTPRPLGESWARPFRVADALETGIPASRLRRGDLAAPFRGVRADSEAVAREALLPLLRPGERLSHATAGALWGVPIPRRVDGQLHLVATDGVNRVRRPGVTGHRGSGQLILRSGVPVSAPADLVIELASELTLEELVAVIDRLVLDPRKQDPSDPRPFADLDLLRIELLSRSGRFIRKARAAADLSRQGCESRRETWLRLLAADTGLPEPECNGELRDAVGRIGFFDLVWRRWRIASEYDGDQHRTSTEQYEKDITRFDRAAAIGWDVIRVRNAGYRDPDLTRRRLLDSFRARGWRPGS